MNKVFLTGRMAKDPVKRQTPSGIAVCNFTIAVNRPNTRREDNIPPDFFDCVVWRGGADVVEKHFHKGDGISIVGHIQNKQWTDKEGNNRTGTEIQVDEFEFPMARKQQAADASQPEQAKPETYVEADEQLPF